MDEKQARDKASTDFDRRIGSLEGINDVVKSAISHARETTPIVGNSIMFTVQTFRHRELGDTVFIEAVSNEGAVRLALPATVSNIIARQRESLGKQLRRKLSRAAAQDRKARGILPGFMKNPGRGKRKKAAK